MRRRTIVIAAVLLAAAAGIAGLTLGRTATHPPAPHRTTTAEHDPAPAGPDAGSTAPATLPSLIAPGSEIYVDVPAAIALADAGGTTAYLEATPGELTALSDAGSAALVAAVPTLPVGSSAYEAPVTITALSGPVRLDHSTLSAFSVASQPGADPLLSVNTLSTASCAGLPPGVIVLQKGQSLTWCIHAFRRPDAAAAIGTQFQTAAGPYAGAIVWASRAASAGSSIP